MSLIQKQSFGLRAGLEDEVWFIIDGLKQAGSAIECALKALELCSSAHSRAALKKEGKLQQLLESILQVSFKRSTDASSSSAVALICLYVLLIYCYTESDRLVKQGLAGTQGLQMTQLCPVLCQILGLHAYDPAKLSIEQKSELVRILKKCKPATYIPQEYLTCPQAVVLVTLRIATDTVVNAHSVEGLKDVAKDCGLLQLLAHTLAENMAVLSGRQAATFTARTNSCMWYAHTTLAVLDGISVAHPGNSKALSTCLVQYGDSRKVVLPRVLISTLAFSRNTRLAASKATQLCILAALHVLMNLTHESSAGCDAVVQTGGLEAVASVFVIYCSSNQDEPATTDVDTATCSSSQATGPLPDSQDLLGSVADELPLSQSPADFTFTSMPTAIPSEVSFYQQQIKSALCVLVNLVEVSCRHARRLAVSQYSDSGFDIPKPILSDAPALVEAQHKRCLSSTATVQFPNNEKGSSSHASVPMDCDVSESEPSKKRLASGSRRLRRNATKMQPSSVAISGGQCETVADIDADNEQSTPHVGEDSWATTQQSPVDAEVDRKAQVAASSELANTFIKFLCGALPMLWQLSEAARQNAGPMQQKLRARHVTPDVIEDGEQNVESVFVQLYMAILLAFLTRSCPELRAIVDTLTPMPRVIADLQSSLAFYAGHGVMEARSIGRLKQLIQDLS